MVNRDPYQVLGLRPGATQEQIRVAYRKLAKQFHPDVNPTKQAYATTRMSEINVAYQQLTQPQMSYRTPSYNYRSANEDSLWDMTARGKQSIHRKAQQMAGNYEDAKRMAGFNYRWFGFGPEVVKAYKEGLRTAHLNNLDPEKWARNWRRAMRE